MPIINTSFGGTANQVQGGYEGFLKWGEPFGMSGSGMIGNAALWHVTESLTKGVVPWGLRTVTPQGGHNLVSGLGKIGPVRAFGKGLSAVWGAQIANMAGYMPFAAIDMIGQYGMASKRERRVKTYMGNVEMYGEGFRDTRGAQTMRQTALAMIQGSQMGVRSALGKEAFHMHR